MAVGVLCAVLSWQGKTWQWMKKNWTLDHMHRCQNHWVWALTKPSVSSKVLTYSRVLCRSWRGFSDGVNFIYSFYNYFFFTQTWIPFSIFSLCLFMQEKKIILIVFPWKSTCQASLCDVYPGAVHIGRLLHALLQTAGKPPANSSTGIFQLEPCTLENVTKDSFHLFHKWFFWKPRWQKLGRNGNGCLVRVKKFLCSFQRYLLVIICHTTRNNANSAGSVICCFSSNHSPPRKQKCSFIAC